MLTMVLEDTKKSRRDKGRFRFNVYIQQALRRRDLSTTTTGHSTKQVAEKKVAATAFPLSPPAPLIPRLRQLHPVASMLCM